MTHTIEIEPDLMKNGSSTINYKKQFAKSQLKSQTFKKSQLFPIESHLAFQTDLLTNHEVMNALGYAGLHFGDLPADFLKNPFHYFMKHFPRHKRKALLRWLFSMNDSTGSIFAGQTYIGKKANMRRESANRFIADLVEKHSFIAKIYRHMQTCLYIVHPIFNTYIIRKLLRPLFPSFFFLPVILLGLDLNGFSRVEGRNVTQSIIVSRLLKPFSPLILNSSSLSTKKTVPARECYDNTDPVRRQSIHFERKFNLERVMSSTAGTVPAYIEAIKPLKLTLWGKIRLSAFPKGAIDYACSRIKTTQGLKSPFGFFFNLCAEWCKTAKIEPDWGTANHLAAYYKQPDNPPMLEEPNKGNEYAPQQPEAPFISCTYCQQHTLNCPVYEKRSNGFVDHKTGKRELDTEYEQTRFEMLKSQLNPDGAALLNSWGITNPFDREDDETTPDDTVAINEKGLNLTEIERYGVYPTNDTIDDISVDSLPEFIGVVNNTDNDIALGVPSYINEEVWDECLD